jgi:hypothetical protein
MGKNTMMKRSIRLYCEETGNDQWAPILDQLVGNVGLVFTKGDLSQVRDGGRGVDGRGGAGAGAGEPGTKTAAGAQHSSSSRGVRSGQVSTAAAAAAAEAVDASAAAAALYA